MTDKSKDKKKKMYINLLMHLQSTKISKNMHIEVKKRKLRQKRSTSIHDFCYETKFCFYFDYFPFEAKKFASKWKTCLNLLAFLNDLIYFHIILSFHSIFIAVLSAVLLIYKNRNIYIRSMPPFWKSSPVILWDLPESTSRRLHSKTLW